MDNAYIKFQIVLVIGFFAYTIATELNQVFPSSFVFTHFFMAAVVFFYGFNGIRSVNDFFLKRNNRIKALKAAKNHLKPYSKIFGDFTLYNELCSVTYIRNKMIFGLEKGADGQSRTFKAVREGFVGVEIEEFFEILCTNFTSKTNYESLYSMCSKSNFTLGKEGKEKTQSVQDVELVCVNTANEAEIAALPGISVILAKKIIKRRETNPFNSVDEFIRFINLREHFSNQIKTLVKISPANTKKELPKEEESKAPPKSDIRIVDI